nr:neurochondrin isoform X2 [Ipomoea batatas]
MDQENQASSSGTSSSSQSQPPLQPSLNDCLKLLRGERDEQCLAGLLLVTKFCSKDHDAIRKVYDIVGPQFLHRSWMGKGEADGGRKENRDAYLQLSITVLSAFCRVLEIAASEDVVTKIPLILEVMSQEPVPPLLEECNEILLLVSRAHEGSVMTLYTSGILEVLTLQMPSFPYGSHLMELAMLLIQLIVSKLPEERVYSEYVTELSLLHREMIVVVVVDMIGIELGDVARVVPCPISESRTSVTNVTGDMLRGGSGYLLVR